VVPWGGGASRFSLRPNADPALPSEAMCARALQQFLAEENGLGERGHDGGVPPTPAGLGVEQR